MTRANPLLNWKRHLWGVPPQGKGGGSALKKKLWLLGLLALAGLSLWLVRVLDIQRLSALLAEAGDWAVPLYFLLWLLLPAFFFPVALLALAGGLLFGLFWGSVYTFVGALLNCGFMFLLSRGLGRAAVERLVRRRLSPRWQQRLAQAGGRRGFLLLIVLRLIPAVPYNLINYGFGLSSISFGSYILASALGIVPGTLVFINIGDKALDPASPGFWLALGLLGLLLAVTALLGHRLFPQPNDKTETEDHPL